MNDISRRLLILGSLMSVSFLTGISTIVCAEETVKTSKQEAVTTPTATELEQKIAVFEAKGIDNLTDAEFDQLMGYQDALIALHDKAINVEKQKQAKQAEAIKDKKEALRNLKAINKSLSGT